MMKELVQATRDVLAVTVIAFVVIAIMASLPVALFLMFFVAQF